MKLDYVIPAMAQVDIPGRVREGLERRGLDAVRVLLATASGPGEGAVVHGLTDLDDKWISRADAEAWIREQTAKNAQRDQWRFWVTLSVATIAALAGIVAAVASVLAVVRP